MFFAISSTSSCTRSSLCQCRWNFQHNLTRLVCYCVLCRISRGKWPAPRTGHISLRRGKQTYLTSKSIEDQVPSKVSCLVICSDASITHIRPMILCHITWMDLPSFSSLVSSLSILSSKVSLSCSSCLSPSIVLISQWTDEILRWEKRILARHKINTVWPSLHYDRVKAVYSDHIWATQNGLVHLYSLEIEMNSTSLSTCRQIDW